MHSSSKTSHKQKTGQNTNSKHQHQPALEALFLSKEKTVKVTFYADPDIKEWLDSLDAGTKSRTINSLLRQGREQKSDLDEKLSLIESRIRKLEKDSHFDGCAISVIRRIMLNRWGALSAEEFKKEYDDIYFGSRQPNRSP